MEHSEGNTARITNFNICDFKKINMYIYGIFGKKQSQIVNFLKCLFYFPGGEGLRFLIISEFAIISFHWLIDGFNQNFD